MTEQKKPSRVKRYSMIFGAVGLGLAVWLLFKTLGESKPQPRRETGFAMVSLPPPPPPPPPVPVPTPPPVEQAVEEEKMIEQAPVTDEDVRPEPAAEEPPDLGTGIQGSGPGDSFGLSRSGNGVIGGRGGGGDRSKWGWYAAQVQSTVADALRRNKKTRSAQLRIMVKIWPDETGRITRAVLSESTGDAALDRAIAEEVLSGLQLQSPPPEGMPAPIVMRVSARRIK